MDDDLYLEASWIKTQLHAVSVSFGQGLIFQQA